MCTRTENDFLGVRVDGRVLYLRFSRTRTDAHGQFHPGTNTDAHIHIQLLLFPFES